MKKLSALIRGITSTNNGDFYCLNCLHSYRTKDRLKKHKNVCKDHDYCDVEIPDKDNILKYNRGEKSMKVLFIIYANMESLLEKVSICHNNPNKSSRTSGYSLFTYCSFDNTKNSHDYYRGQDCMKMFCGNLKEGATKVISYEKKK